jgi:hypothetical protein
MQLDVVTYPSVPSSLTTHASCNMTVTLDNFEDFHLEIPVGTQRINFFAFNDCPLEEQLGIVDSNPQTLRTSYQL